MHLLARLRMHVTAHQPIPGTRDKHPFLVALGETVRTLRARRGMSRRALAVQADVSERHLANLESGVGNASILVLRQVADALGCPLTDLFNAGGAASPDATLIRE